MVVSLATALLKGLASQNRRIFADWRALILLRRATFDLHQRERRWSQLPEQISNIQPLLRQMRQRDEIIPIPGTPHLFQVTVHYARSGVLDELEVFSEASPYGVLSHYSAMVFHSITLDFPQHMTGTVPSEISTDFLPLGTESEDWEDLELPRNKKPVKILNTPVKWTSMSPSKFFGFDTYRRIGYPLRVTTLERTLLDGLQSPDLSGGISNVLEGWLRARYLINVERLVALTERFDVALLRQRVGYILEELGMSHPRLIDWQRDAYRGSSSVLAVNTPYSPNFSERWSLSLNAPVELLHEEGE